MLPRCLLLEVHLPWIASGADSLYRDIPPTAHSVSPIACQYHPPSLLYWSPQQPVRGQEAL
jgi:hypothetical protein